MAVMNSGMMLLRNTDWTRKFFDHIGRYGEKEMAKLEAVCALCSLPLNG